jgi:hypothetical protein
MGGADEHMASDSIGNDGLVDTVRSGDGLFPMESANSRLALNGLTPLPAADYLN